MSFKTGNTVDNNNLKFFELRKYLVSNENNGIQCVSIDNSNETVFVANDDQLIVISIHNLLNFVWNKSSLNEIIDTFEHFSIGLNFYSHLITVSAKGFGSKLAVCGSDASHDENESPFIAFYDLKSIYRTQTKSTAYSRINLINSKGLVSDICFHPEICDNQFACCLTDGSVYIIHIGDIDSKTTTIMSYMPSSSDAISLSWSPKGKQIVIGFKNGYFSQYKLSNGQQLQEVKKTVLPNNLADYRVLSIKWIVSSLFAIACTKDLNESERDTHIILVSTPSKGSAQFVDFGAICLDNYDVNDSYRINLLHYENMLLCSTSMASDVAIIGCDPQKDISLPENWCQWVLDDSSRIEIPMDRDGNDTYLRGIAISKGTQNTFKINANEVYGGVNCPILMTYNSSGILLPYLIIVKSGHIKVPEAPKIVKLTVSPSSVASQTPTATSTPIVQSITFSPQQTTVTPKFGITSFGSPFTPITSTPIDSKPTPIQPIQAQQPVLASNLISIPNNKSVVPQQSFTPDMSALKSNVSDLSNAKSTQSTHKSNKNLLVAEPSDSTVSPNDLYMDAMTEQMKEFNKLMSATKKKYSQIKAKIGEKEEELKLRMSTRLIDEVLSEIKENFKNCSKDTTTLQASLIESFSLVEEAKSIMTRNVDPKYRFLLKQRALDPITARRMEEINSLNEYIQIQLRELDAKFEMEWSEWLQKRKLKSVSSVARINSSANFEIIYKALANNQRVINCLRSQLDKLEGLSSQQNLKLKSNLIKGLKTESSNKSSDIERLAQSLKKSSIIDFSDEPLSDRVFKLKTIPKEKKLNLKEFLENRPNVPIRRSVDIINSNCSRFISAIEKLKEKQMIANKSKHETNLNVSNGVTNSNSIQNIEEKSKSCPIIVPNVVNENEGKTVIQKPIAVSSQTIELKLGPQNTTNSQLFPSLIQTQESSKSNAIKSNINFQITSKPLSAISFSEENTLIKSPQKTTPTVSLTKTKSGTELIQKEETALETASNISKTVSFGNTTIINPIETKADNNTFKLDTISECTESNETSISSSVANTPFASFKGFGGNVSDVGSALPKLSFNLNKTNTTLFSLKGDSENLETLQKSEDSLPKYEDISPPTTPQTEYPDEQENVETDLTTITTETDPSKPLSILKTTLSAKLLTQNTENKSQKPIEVNNFMNAKASESQSNKTGSDESVSALSFSSQPTITSSSVVTEISSSTPLTTTIPSFISQTVTEPSNTTQESIPSKPIFGSQPEISQKSVPTNSSFGQTSAFGQTPFASNSFSFGNVSTNTTSVTPTFGQGLSFGGSTGFGQTSSAVSRTSSTPSTGSLTFGQQTNALNSLSFCGLGGRPSPEAANKNVFGGNFSTPAPQSNQFGSSPQSSPFNVKPSSGGSFTGSFSSGSGVAQTGFAAFQHSPQQSTPVFGGSPVFGGVQQPAFGGSPTFGGGAQQHSAFGSSPTFGGAPVMGSMSTFGNTQTNTAFGGSGFANTSNSGLSFGALASSAQQTQQTSPFASQFSSSPQPNAFGTSDQSQSFSFTQRRK